MSNNEIEMNNFNTTTLTPFLNSLLPFNTTSILRNITLHDNRTSNASDGSIVEQDIAVTKYIIIVVCFISAVIGLSGNLTIVIVRIFKQVQRGNTTAYTFLICQLAIADFIFAFTICFDIHVYLHNDQWTLGVGSCKFIKLIQSASLTTTVGFLTIMAYERYCGISRPLKHRWSIKTTCVIVLILWAYIFVTFVPFVTALDVQFNYCGEYNHPSETFRKGYTMFLFLTNYVTPLVSITLFHTLIVHHMKKHMKAIRTQRHRGSSPSVYKKKKPDDFDMLRKASTTSSLSMTGDQTCGNGDTNCWVVIYRLIRDKIENAHNNNNSSNKDANNSDFSRAGSNRRSNVFKRLVNRSKTNEDKKLVKMLVAVTLSFALMTLPTQIYYIWYDFRTDSERQIGQVGQTILEMISSLVYLHCCANCVIYSAMDKKFRVDVEKTFRFLFNCQKKAHTSRTSFARVTLMSRLSRSSRHSSSTTATTTTTTSSMSKKSDDAMVIKKQKPPLEAIQDEEDNVFILERETVIM